MSKKIVIDKEKVERSEHSELIKTAISLLIKHGVATELSTDESIEERAKKCFNKELDGFIITKDNEQVQKELIKFATEQSLIEQMKAKELNLQKNNECKNSSHNGEVKWAGKCSVCGSKMMN